MQACDAFPGLRKARRRLFIRRSLTPALTAGGTWTVYTARGMDSVVHQVQGQIPASHLPTGELGQAPEPAWQSFSKGAAQRPVISAVCECCLGTVMARSARWEPGYPRTDPVHTKMLQVAKAPGRAGGRHHIKHQLGPLFSRRSVMQEFPHDRSNMDTARDTRKCMLLGLA